MDFVQYIDTPAGTTQASPLITRIKLTKGRLMGGFLYFPYGPAGTLHFQARLGLTQILPFNAGGSYCLDDAVVPLSMGIMLINPPYVIDCVTWNTSESYSHALTVGFFLDPRVKAKYVPGVLDKFLTESQGYWKP